MTPEQEANSIKIAEAMGWKWKQHPNEAVDMVGRWHKNGVAYGSWVPYEAAPIDPYTDANADYAVLEFIHASSTGFELSQRFMKKLQFPAHQYRLGNYADAFLEVINNDT